MFCVKQSIWIIRWSWFIRDSSAISDMSAVELMKLVQELPAGFRTVFNLFAIEGYSHKEISEMLNITESTSRSQFTRAKQLLQRRIHELY